MIRLLQCLVPLISLPLLWACGTVDPEMGRPPAGLTWGGYLYGEDLRQTCSEKGPDRYRFVVNRSHPGHPMRVFEVVGTALRGGFIETHELSIGGRTGIETAEPYLPPRKVPTAAQRLRLSPADFAAMGEQLVVSGTFLPPMLAPDLTRVKTRWFVSGCREGTYFLAADAAPGRIRRDSEVRYRAR